MIRLCTITFVAKDIGVNESLVRTWVIEYGTHGKDAFYGKDKLRLEVEDIIYIVTDEDCFI